MFKNNKKGFTLIELLVVIAIIGLLATLAVVALGNARQKSRDAKRVSDIKQIQTALELRYVETDTYPDATVDGTGGTDCNTSGPCRLGSSEVTSLGSDGWNDTTGQVYMGLVPRDPSADGAPGTACVGTGDATGCEYGYEQNGSGYNIWLFLEGDTGGLDVADGGGSVCATQNGITVGSCVN